MVRSILAKISFALPLLLAIPAVAQGTHNVVLNFGQTGVCYGLLQQEFIDGQPYDISPWQGYSMSIDPNSIACPGNPDGGINIELPPQPYIQTGTWVYVQPVASQVVRGVKIPVSGSTTLFTETDSFSFVGTYTWFTQWTDSWTGQVTRNLQKITHCGRYGCSYKYVDLSDVVNAQVTIAQQ